MLFIDNAINEFGRYMNCLDNSAIACIYDFNGSTAVNYLV